MKSYKLTKDRFGVPAGTIVYPFKNDVGALASTDTRLTGRQHLAVTKRADGYGLGFTAPVDDLEEMPGE